jgi:hypothetical protein
MLVSNMSLALSNAKTASLLTMHLLVITAHKCSVLRHTTCSAKANLSMRHSSRHARDSAGAAPTSMLCISSKSRAAILTRIVPVSSHNNRALSQAAQLQLLLVQGAPGSGWKNTTACCSIGSSPSYQIILPLRRALTLQHVLVQCMGAGAA